MGRTNAFTMGALGNPDGVASSLGQDSARFNDQVGRNFTPESVLNQTVVSGNGMSSKEYGSRMLANGMMLPDQNGMSASTSRGVDKLLLDGKPTVGTL